MPALADLSKIIEAAANLGLELNSSKCELVFLGCPDDHLKASILSDFNRICPKIEVTDLKDLVILGAPIGGEARRTLLTGKKQELDNMCDFLENFLFFLVLRNINLKIEFLKIENFRILRPSFQALFCC